MPTIEAQALNAHELIAMEDRYGAHNYHPLDVVIERAEGVWVYDVQGKRYLDCLAAYSAVNQGHCHPRILKTLIEQAHKVTLTSRAFRNEQLPLLCKELHELTGMDMALLMNSGAEAVETAVKAARKWGYTKKGIPDGSCRNYCLWRKFPWAHRHHHQLLQRTQLSLRFWSPHSRLPHHSFW